MKTTSSLNAVFHFAAPLTSDATVSQIMEIFLSKCLYSIYYNLFIVLRGVNVGKTEKVNSGLNFPKLMAY